MPSATGLLHRDPLAPAPVLKKSAGPQNLWPSDPAGSGKFKKNQQKSLKFGQNSFWTCETNRKICENQKSAELTDKSTEFHKKIGHQISVGFSKKLA
jgi:hypothetical protein